MELIAFQRAYDMGSAYLKDNELIIVRGRVSVRDEKEPQLMVDSIRPISDLGKLPAQKAPAAAYDDPALKLWVKISGENDPLLERIKLILTMFPGRQQMIIYCEGEKKRIGTRCCIHAALVDELKELCGEKNVVVK